MFEELIRVLSEKGTSKLILLHHNADPDAVGSGYALMRAFPNVTVGASESINKISERLSDELGFKVDINPDPSLFDVNVILDTSSKTQLGDLAASLKDPYVVDHHSYTGDWAGASYCHCDEAKSSCAEIVYEILKEAGFCFSAENSAVALALLTGMATDTARFRYANAAALRSFAALMGESGVTMDDVLCIVEGEPFFDKSRKIAHLKAAQRSRFESLFDGDVVVATSHVSSFEASASKSLLLIGADVAFVACRNGDELRVSARAKSSVVENYGLHLGYLMNEVSREVGDGVCGGGSNTSCDQTGSGAGRRSCGGGGHAGAAGFNGINCEEKKVIDLCVSKLKLALNEKPATPAQDPGAKCASSDF